MNKTDRISGKFMDEEEMLKNEKQKTQEASAETQLYVAVSVLRSIPLPLQSPFFFNSFAFVDEMNPYGTHWDWTFFSSYCT